MRIVQTITVNVDFFSGLVLLEIFNENLQAKFQHQERMEVTLVDNHDRRGCVVSPYKILL